MPRTARRAGPTRTASCIPALAGFLAVLGACSPDYDVVIAGGRVMDPESGLDAVRDVGIRGGRVEMISEEPLKGTAVIDAEGLVVAPGFIDLHRHGHSERAYRLQVHDGVTTGLELELGTAHVGRWLEERGSGQLVNYGVSVGHLGVRAVALGDPITGTGGRTTRRAATDDELDETERLLRVGLAQGAIGVGFGVAYTPGASMAEVERMLSVVAQRGVAAFVHTRNGLAGLDSMITAAGRVEAPLHVVHANSSGGAAVEPFLARIQGARDLGLDVTTEAYPYAASQSLIESAVFDGWESWPDERFQQYEWIRTGERLTRASFPERRRQGGSVIIHSRTDEMTRAAVLSPLTMVASDGALGHPRGAGTFARILGRYVRDQGDLALMDALARMTIRPARRIEAFAPAMENKGRLRIGADADITVFDPATVADRATYHNPQFTSEGILYVLVNGVIVVREGELVEGVRPGRAIEGKPNYSTY